jgi:DNA-binding transcriptional regulator GbsR (MarR family)
VAENDPSEPADAPGVVAAQRDDEAVAQFVEHAARVFADWGFPRMAARVLFVMMTANEPGLTAADLAERLGVSPAAISGAVTYLIQLGLLERVPVPGSRRDLHRNSRRLARKCRRRSA